MHHHKIAFIVPSVIEPSDHAFTYSKVRSYFTPDERLVQTVATAHCVAMLPDTDVFIVDGSPTNYQPCFAHLRNCRYVHMPSHYGHHILNMIRNTPNKSQGEANILATIMEDRYVHGLDQYDGLVKLSGRYLINNTFNPNDIRLGIYFKAPMAFPWKDDWGYDKVDLRASQHDNFLRQYCSVLFGWGSDHNDYMASMLRKISLFLHDTSNHHYDMETMLYYYATTGINGSIRRVTHVPWTVSGWHGCTGNFVHQ